MGRRCGGIVALAVLIVAILGASGHGSAPVSRREVADLGPEWWTPLGPTHVVDGHIGVSGRAREMSGRVTAIAVHPSRHREVWLVGTAAGGVWRTRDGGSSWTAGRLPYAAGDFQPLSLTVAALAFGPGGCLAYAGTGDVSNRVHTSTGTGLLVSDGDEPGVAWRRLPTYHENRQTRFEWFKTRVVAMVVTGGACINGVAGPHDLWIVTLPAPSAFFASGGEPARAAAQFLGLFRAKVRPGQDVVFRREQPGRFSDLKADAAGRLYAARITSSDAAAGGAAVLRCAMPCEASGDWTPLKEYKPPPVPEQKDIGKLAVAAAGTVYASFVDGGGGIDLLRNDAADTCTTACQWRSIAFGASVHSEMGSARPGYCNWDPSRPMPKGSLGASCSHTNAMSVHPERPQTLYAGGVALWRCLECDASPGDAPTWEDVSFVTPRPPKRLPPWERGFWETLWTRPAAPRFGIHVDQQAMAWSGDRLIVGNDGGVWSWDTSRDDVRWENHNFGGLAITQIYRGALDPRRPDVVFAGTQDVGTVRRDGWRWRWLHGGDGLGVVVSHHDPALHWAILVKSVLYADVVVLRTKDGGLTYQRADLGVATRSNQYPPPFAQCPDPRKDVVLFGSKTLWRVDELFNVPTTRAFEHASPPTWRANHQPKAAADLTAIAFAQRDDEEEPCDRYAIADTNGLVRETTSGGAAWTPHPPLGALRTISALAYGPGKHPTLYVARSTYHAGAKGYVLRTDPVDGWKDITPAAEPVDRPFRALAVTKERVVFAGSDYGVWMSSDDGASWCRMAVDAATPHPPIMDLRIHPVTRDVYAFTFGRGVFRLRGVDRAVEACTNALR
jgi:hypothetical protein